MEQGTPLRRSDRIRRQTPKAMGSSPSSSPRTSANAGRLIYPRSTLFQGPGDQSDSDSSLQSTTSSKSSGSFTGSTVVVTVAMLPPKLAHDYRVLAPIVDYSDAELMEHDIVGLNSFATEIKAFTQTLVSVFGHSCQWPEETKFLNLCKRIAKVVDAKKAALPPKMPPGEESWTDIADRKYIQDLYRNAAPPSNFSWDDVVGSGVQSQETPLDYSLGYPYPQPRSIDYCTIPDNY